jgi:osmotically-inducible protein OsmY
MHKMLVIAIMAAAPVVAFANTETDRQIEDAAKASYNFKVVLDNNVKAKVDDGVVTLRGTVQDRGQRDLAEDTVKNLPGVVTVINKIKVESEPPERSDAWIAFKIHSELLVHANVSATATHVDVSNGVVTLSGIVDNSAQKDLTEEYVKDVDGVQSVKNDLVVSDHHDEATDHPVRENIDDASITSEVKFQLLSHRSTSAIDTKVSTKDGVVTIAGEANSDAEKDLVTKLATSIRGVRSVQNEMTVRNY